MRPVLAAVCISIATALVGASLTVGGSPAAAVGSPEIYPPDAIHAPVGKKGAIMASTVTCSDVDVEPRVRVVIEDVDSDQQWEESWTGGYPGMWMRRIPVGRYDVTTHASCRRNAARRIDTLRVREKTRQHTMSWSEYQQIRRGMSPRRVAAIVGYRGRFNYRYDGITSRTYDNMAFWAWSVVEYRRGRVDQKLWDVGHD